MGNTIWFHVGSLNDISSTMTEEEKRKYRQKMFKWGLKLEKMKPNKPKFVKKKKNKENVNEETEEINPEIESFEQKVTKEAEKEEISRKHDKIWF